jgi:hypothetical protein
MASDRGAIQSRGCLHIIVSAATRLRNNITPRMGFAGTRVSASGPAAVAEFVGIRKVFSAIYTQQPVPAPPGMHTLKNAPERTFLRCVRHLPARTLQALPSEWLSVTNPPHPGPPGNSARANPRTLPNKSPFGTQSLPFGKVVCRFPSLRGRSCPQVLWHGNYHRRGHIVVCRLQSTGVRIFQISINRRVRLRPGASE